MLNLKTLHEKDVGRIKRSAYITI